jgi:polysaccharide export outer membrane protein
VSARLSSSALAVVLALAANVACASVPDGGYVWVDEFRPRRVSAPATGIIQPGDTLDVRVLGQEQLSAKVKVRPDGQVTLPFLNDLQAAGQTPKAVADVISKRLKEYVNTPIVTVNVEQAAPSPISVLGEVTKPGKFPFEPGLTVLDALALAGGMTEYGHKDRVFVLRGQPEPTRVRFDTRRLMRGEGRGLAFTLEPGDVVVVE